MAGGPAPLPLAQAGQSWTSGRKPGHDRGGAIGESRILGELGTSRVWATIGQGILNEIYWPAVDQPQVKDFGFLIGGVGVSAR